MPWKCCSNFNRSQIFRQTSASVELFRASSKTVKAEVDGKDCRFIINEAFEIVLAQTETNRTIIIRDKRFWIRDSLSSWEKDLKTKIQFVLVSSESWKLDKIDFQKRNVWQFTILNVTIHNFQWLSSGVNTEIHLEKWRHWFFSHERVPKYKKICTKWSKKL